MSLHVAGASFDRHVVVQFGSVVAVRIDDAVIATSARSETRFRNVDIGVVLRPDGNLVIRLGPETILDESIVPSSSGFVVQGALFLQSKDGGCSLLLETA